MYPWISRTLDFWLQVCEKKCSLYIDFYGNFFPEFFFSKLGVWLICECGLYIGVYGNQLRVNSQHFDLTTNAFKVLGLNFYRTVKTLLTTSLHNSLGLLSNQLQINNVLKSDLMTVVTAHMVYFNASARSEIIKKPIKG